MKGHKFLDSEDPPSAWHNREMYSHTQTHHCEKKER